MVPTFKVVLLEDESEDVSINNAKQFVVLIQPRLPNFESFKEAICERFPVFNNRPLYMFYKDTIDNVILNTKSDFELFQKQWSTTLENYPNLYVRIVLNPKQKVWTNTSFSKDDDEKIGSSTMDGPQNKASVLVEKNTASDNGNITNAPVSKKPIAPENAANLTQKISHGIDTKGVNGVCQIEKPILRGCEEKSLSEIYLSIINKHMAIINGSQGNILYNEEEMEILNQANLEMLLHLSNQMKNVESNVFGKHDWFGLRK